MRIAYGKLGRSFAARLEDCSSVGGDIEVVRLMQMLARDHEVHLVGRNQGNAPSNIINHWDEGGCFHGCPSASRNLDAQYQAFVEHLDRGAERLPEFDAWVIWLGQHGSSLHPVPMTQKSKLGGITSPLISLVNYGYPLVRLINRIGVRPIWLCPDPRNMIKMRDLWDPKQRTVLAQYRREKNDTFYDDRDGHLRQGVTKYVYSGIELLAVPREPIADLTRPRKLFGLLVNEGPTNVPNRRVDLVQRYLKDAPFEWELFGDWTEESQRLLGREVSSVPVTEVRATLSRWRSTITFPASNTGWATSKPWESFAAGTVCFAHYMYDDQHHIYGQHMPEELRSFLRPFSAAQMWERVRSLEDDAFYQSIVRAQLRYLEESRVRLLDGAAAVQEAIIDAAQ